jgi:hypothetical protein
MEKAIKVQEVKQQKEYVAPKLSTHGDVAKLTQKFTWPPTGPGSELR